MCSFFVSLTRSRPNYGVFVATWDGMSYRRVCEYDSQGCVGFPRAIFIYVRDKCSHGDGYMDPHPAALFRFNLFRRLLTLYAGKTLAGEITKKNA